MSQAKPVEATKTRQRAPGNKPRPDVDRVSDASEDNAPLAVRGGGSTFGSTGKRTPVSKAEQIERRKVALGFIANRVPMPEIAEVMQQQFGMSRFATRHLVQKLEAELLDTDREILPLTRAKQVNRLHAHINSARRDKSWNAVASLERLLASVQGTLEPTRVHVQVDAQVREAVTHVLGAMNGEQIKSLLTTGDLTTEANTNTRERDVVLDTLGEALPAE